MYTKKVVVGLILVLVTLTLNARGEMENTQTMKIDLDTTRTFQTIEHFGASAAWWAQDVGTWPLEQRNAILDLLFHKTRGIGLNLVRYNIGGGKEIARIKDPWRSAESPYSPGKPLDWTRDQAAMGIIDGAVERGAGVILFSNSPPAEMTVSGAPTGRGSRNNLAPESAKDFAQFLADCVLELAERWPLVALSPINEPQWDWQPSKGQEGCYWSPEDASAFLELLVDEYARRGISLPLSFIDSAEWSMARNKSYLDALLGNPKLRAAMGHYAVHSYWSMGEDREDLSAYVANKAPGLALWQTEWTEMRSGKDAGMQGALTLANTVLEDFTLGGVSSWQYWIAVSKYDYADGLIYVDPVAKTLEATKRLWALGNWSRFVQPGARRLEASVSMEARLRVNGFRNPDGSVVLVLVNGDNESSPAVSLGGAFKGGRRHETSVLHDLDQVPLGNLEALVFPAESVTTLVFEGQ